MRIAQRVAILLLVALVVVGCDKATKNVAQERLRGADPIVYLDGMVRIQYAENTGAFLSLGARLPETTQRWIFIGGVSVILAGLLIYALWELQNLHILLLLGFALILGGGLGNLIDRILNDGRVVDFLNVGIGGLRTGVFNLADMALTTGVVLVAVVSLLAKEHKPAAQLDDTA